jgi:hypothetical protein
MNRTVSFFTAATNGGQTGTEFGFKGLPASLDSVGGIPGIVLTNIIPSLPVRGGRNLPILLAIMPMMRSRSYMAPTL